MINHITLCGRLTRDISVNKTANGLSKGMFAIALNKSKNEAIFVPCVLFGNLCDSLSPYMKKGTKVVVGGQLDTYSSTGADGQKRSGFSVIVNVLEFCEKKQQTEPAAGYYPTDEIDIGDENLPF